MGEDDPWRVLSQIVERTVFPHHPYGRPIIGFTETLEAMSPESMRDYYRRFYHPGNATIVLAGDVKAEDAVRAVEARFGGIEAGVPFEQADSFRPKLKEPLGEVRCGTTWDDPADRMIMAWPTTAVGTQDDYAIDLLMNVLTNGRSSRLWRRLVIEEGLATSVTSVNDSRVEAGAFWLYAEASQGVEPAAVEKVVEEELVRIRDTMCKPEELARARSMILASYAYDGETVSDVAEHLGEWAVDADWRMAFDDGVNYERLTEASLRDTAARFLVPERRVVGWCRPSEE